MNIQEYFEEKERKEQENTIRKSVQDNTTQNVKEQTASVIPVIQEQARIDKTEIESAKIKVQKKVVEVEKTVDIPLMKEGYDIERVPVNRFIDTHPPIREEGNVIIVPVVREVLVVEKRLELVEELHIIKHETTVDHKESFTLRKEEVNVERISTDNRHV
jgi:uncharacterized protein (TIGR02271 family)